jgi:murein L,D-transpeptidase YcbB/YkuD
LKNADNEGLTPEDYGGPRWESRISDLQQSGPPPESELVQFDVALTVSAMRYISDLHLGRVNPRRFHFELDIDHTNFDLSEFLQQQVVNATDMDSVIAAVEPPFPTYHRT